jgi:hypothetical protein
LILTFIIRADYTFQILIYKYNKSFACVENPKIQYVNDPRLLAELEAYRQQNARLMEQYTALIKRIEE